MAWQFTALRNICANFKKLDEEKLMHAVFQNTSLQQDILDLNRQDQLFDYGITADGKSLGKYSAATIQGTANFKGKIELGLPYDHITLFDTGAFYATFKFKNQKQNFVITANTLKPDVDLLTYGNILGLTTKNTMVVAGWAKAPLIDEMRKKLFKIK